MDMPLISVIVPVYNTEKYLSKCIESILHQSYANFEVLIVDDGSTDGSFEICKGYARNDPRIRLFSQPNQGQAVARNLALDHMKGSLVAFVDSDDSIEVHSFETLVKAMIDSQAQLAIFGVRYDNGLRIRNKVSYTESRIFTGEELFREYLSTQNISGCLWDKMYTAELFRTIRFPRLRKNEDAYILPQIFCVIEKAVYIDKCLYVQLTRQGSTERCGFSEKSLAILECEETLMRCLEEKYPQFMPVAVYRKTNAAVSLLYEMWQDFCVFRYRAVYQQLREYICEEYEIAKTMMTCDSHMNKKTRMALNCYPVFAVTGICSGIKKRFKLAIKGLLISIKRRQL